MAKGPKVIGSVKLVIAAIYREHPDWPAKMITKELHNRLKAKGPGLSVVQKELARIRGSLKVYRPEDEPWTFTPATLIEHPILPGAFPMVLTVQKLVKEPRRPLQTVLVARELLKQPVGFTIHDAKWVAQLSALVPDYIPNVGLLAAVALACSCFEILYEIAETPFDYMVMDEMFMFMAPELGDERTTLYIASDLDHLSELFEEYFIDIISKLRHLKWSKPK